MARAAFLVDRLMRAVGLHGKAFVPLLSSFACAVPGIMATRTIENPKDRVATILVAPFMSCSARLPVYTLVIAAFFSGRKFLGIISLGAVLILAMYVMGIIVAIVIAWILKLVIMRYSDRSGLHRALPFFFGLMIGQFVVGSLWNIYGILMQVPTYQFWQ